MSAGLKTVESVIKLNHDNLFSFDCNALTNMFENTVWLSATTLILNSLVDSAKFAPS